MRLVGELEPLRENDVPQDPFEVTALEQAMQGQAHAAVEKVNGKWATGDRFPSATFTPHAACVTRISGPSTRASGSVH